MYELNELINKTINSLYLVDYDTPATREFFKNKDVPFSTEQILFFASGSDNMLTVYEVAIEADCCSSSWVETIEGVENFFNQPITSINESYIDKIEKEDDVEKRYNLVFSTLKGQMTIDFRNSSNGYYGAIATLYSIDTVTKESFLRRMFNINANRITTDM